MARVGPLHHCFECNGILGDVETIQELGLRPCSCDKYGAGQYVQCYVGDESFPVLITSTLIGQVRNIEES